MSDIQSTQPVADTENFERWRMPSGRIATINLSDHAVAVQDARDLLAMNGAEQIDENTSCVYDWCDQDHDEFAAPYLHYKAYVRGAIRFDFVLDERPDAEARTSLNWTDSFEEDFTSDRLGELNDIAADIIVGKAAFEKFVTEVTV